MSVKLHLTEEAEEGDDPVQCAVGILKMNDGFLGLTFKAL